MTGALSTRRNPSAGAIRTVLKEGRDQILSRLGGSFDVALNEAQYQSILTNNVFYRQDMELAPGTYSVDIVVRDRLSGKMTARREPLVLAEADSAFSMRGAVLSRRVEPAGPAVAAGDAFSYGGALISPLPSREFSAALWRGAGGSAADLPSTRVKLVTAGGAGFPSAATGGV